MISASTSIDADAFDKEIDIGNGLAKSLCCTRAIDPEAAPANSIITTEQPATDPDTISDRTLDIGRDNVLGIAVAVDSSPITILTRLKFPLPIDVLDPEPMITMGTSRASTCSTDDEFDTAPTLVDKGLAKASALMIEPEFVDAGRLFLRTALTGIIDAESEMGFSEP
jgi:hypothetical protein